MTTTLQVIRDEHAAVSAVLRSMLMMLDHGTGERPEQFFDAFRAMLFYIDEFPERHHHPKESDLLFPAVARAAPELMPVIRRLEDDHMAGESKVREMQHLLLAWELLGESRKEEFELAARKYVAFYLQHMQVEETELLPAARTALSKAQWAEIDEVFCQHHDPMSGQMRDSVYDRLFSRIVMSAPAPIGVGPALETAHPRSARSEGAHTRRETHHQGG